MTKPKSKYPVASFGPELLNFLRKAGQEKVVVVFADEGEPQGKGKKTAHNFQRRVNTLRSKMREENHPDYKFVYRVKVSIFWGADAIPHGASKEWEHDTKGDRGAIVVGQPHDLEFRDALVKAGLSFDPPKPEAPKVYEPEPEGEEVPQTLQQLERSLLDEILGEDDTPGRG